MGLASPDDKRLARSVPAHDVDRDRRLLTARPAERHVQVAVEIEGRVVDLVHAGRERRPDLDVGGLAWRAVDADRRVPAVEPGRDDDGQRLARRVRRRSPARRRVEPQAAGARG